MRLPSQKKILLEDLKGAPEWIRPMVDVLNSFMESVYQAMNKNITFSQNIASFYKELIYTTPASYPSGVANIEFMSQLKTKAVGIELMQAYERSTYVPATGPVYVPWVDDNGTLIIYPIQGLEAEKTYVIRLLVT